MLAIIPVKAVELKDVRVIVPGGYTLFTGWTVQRLDNGKFYSTNGQLPWNPIGGKRAAESVAASGLYDSAGFIHI